MSIVGKVSQIAYVTEDLNKSIELFKERYGISEFLEMRDVELGDLGTLDIGMAYLGDTMLELIAPKDGASAMYRKEQLDFHRQAHEFHHIGIIVDDQASYDALKASYIERGLRITADVQHDVLDFFYVDATEDLGHYVEYMLLHDIGKDVFATIPRV